MQVVTIRLSEADVTKLDQFAEIASRKLAATNKAAGIYRPPLTRSDVVRSCVDAYFSDPDVQAILTGTTP